MSERTDDIDLGEVLKRLDAIEERLDHLTVAAKKGRGKKKVAYDKIVAEGAWLRNELSGPPPVSAHPQYALAPPGHGQVVIGLGPDDIRRIATALGESPPPDSD